MKIEVNAFPRAQQGSSANRRLRIAGRVPGILYGVGKDAQNVEVDHRLLLRQLQLEAFHASVLDLTLNGEKLQVLHVDFQRVDKNRKIHMRVPLHFLNADICPGVKTGGGVVQPAMNDIDIQCLPDDLPAFIEVDLRDLQLNDTLHVMELPMPKGVEPVSKLKHENPSVVSVHVPKEIVIEEEVAAPVTEIIGEVPAEGEEGAEAAAEGEKKEGAPEKKEPAAAEKKEPAKKGKE